MGRVSVVALLQASPTERALLKIWLIISDGWMNWYISFKTVAKIWSQGLLLYYFPAQFCCWAIDSNLAFKESVKLIRTGSRLWRPSQRDTKNMYCITNLCIVLFILSGFLDISIVFVRLNIQGKKRIFFRFIRSFIRAPIS